MTDQVGDRQAAELVLASLQIERVALDKLAVYADLLQGHRLVGLSTLPVLWTRHFVDSARLLPFCQGRSGPLVDIGSGAGFPGMVLAILGCLDVHLVEPRRSRATFLANVSRETSTPVTIHKAPIAQISLAAGFAQVITARAVTNLSALIAWSAPFYAPSTVGLFFKGARYAEDLRQAQQNHPNYRFTIVRENPQLAQYSRGVLIQVVAK
ncbi:MAG: RsmG family class I SAM-dependent methyltransferase [Pseudomonadota bacterium]